MLSQNELIVGLKSLRFETEKSELHSIYYEDIIAEATETLSNMTVKQYEFFRNL